MFRFYLCLINIFTHLYKYWVKLLTIIGNIKIFKTPFYILYDPNDFDYKIRGETIDELKKLIKPGDIFLRKYDHYLDGFLIPGNYSHSAIYIGKNKIIHAVAEGVKEIHLIDFCQCDGLCILRPKNNKLIKKALSIAKMNLNKPYDFKFNTNDSSEFYCHELVRTCYPKINISAFIPKFFGIRFKCLQKRYIDRSFINNKEFKKILEI